MNWALMIDVVDRAGYDNLHRDYFIGTMYQHISIIMNHVIFSGSYVGMMCQYETWNVFNR